MKRFFALTFRPFFVVTGALTALGSLNAFWPQWTVETIERITFIREYTVIVQHWGVMLGVMGIFMIVAAYRVEWRTPILLFCLFEKAFVVYLILANRSHPYAEGFRPGAVMDATVVVYTIAFFAAHRFNIPSSENLEGRMPIEGKPSHSTSR